MINENYPVFYPHRVYFQGGSLLTFIVCMYNLYEGSCATIFNGKPVCGLCFARVFTETLGIWSMLCHICLLKHPVYERRCIKMFSDAVSVWLSFLSHRK